MELLFVVEGVFLDLFFGFHAEDLALGDEEAGKALHGHPVVAVGVVGGDGPLIAPKEPHFGPVELWVLGEFLVDRFGGGSSGEGDGEAASLLDGSLGGVEPVFDGEENRLFGVAGDDVVSAGVPIFQHTRLNVSSIWR